MKEIENLRKQLAREDDLLSAAEDKIDSARDKIESLREQIETSKREIQSTEQLIEKLRANSETIKKRRSLLLQYIELAKVGNDPEPEGVTEESTEARPVTAATPPGEAAAAVTANSPPAADEMIGDDAAAADIDWEQDLDDLPYIEPLESGPRIDDDERTAASLDKIDDLTFTHEVLPHTETFAEELLLVLAHHRKATAAKNVVRIFRRLDYAPKQPATEENVTALIELNPHFYQYAAGGRIALTREGRNEATRLLAELL